MKKKIALICNIRTIIDPTNLEFEKQADFDDKETIDGIKNSIENNGYEVFIVQEKLGNPEKELEKKKSEIYLAFNFTEGDFIPNILEKFSIPYTGSDAKTQKIIYDKHETKKVLQENGLSTADWQLVESENFELKKTLKFPLIVKPNSHGSSAGITNKSIVNNMNELKNQIKNIFDQFSCKIIIETFLSGREFSVGMVGNPPVIMPIIEADHSTLPADFPKIDSLEVKRMFEEEDNGGSHLICPAKITQNLEEKIHKLCLDARNGIGIHDYCRIDLRCDAEGNPYILEINSPAGLIPPEVSTTSYLPLMARKIGISHQKLIGIIIDETKKRYKI